MMMKRIMALIVFALMLTQVVGASHAFADSLHHNHVQADSSIVDSIIAGTTDDSGDALTPEHAQSCQYNCHSHCHTQLFLGAKSFDIAPSQGEISLHDSDQLFTGLVHELDSPPPNIL